MAEKHAKGVKRYGTRYGRTIKRKLGKIEAQQKADYACPQCAYKAVKRLAAGIWMCKKCDAKFTSRAYMVRTAPEITSKTAEAIDV